MSSQKPLHIAVAIPCFNAEKWIGRAILSALQQNYSPLSIIVIDDGSRDNSVKKVREFGDAVFLQDGPNRGACAARNNGLRLALNHGADYIVFLDADDYLEGEIIQGAARMASETEADLVISNMHIEYQGGHREERFLYAGEIAAEEFFEGWMKMDYVNPSALLWRTDFVEKIGGWDESLSRAQDLDITLRAMLASPRIWKNERGAAIHARVNDHSISKNVSYSATDSRLRVQEKLLSKITGTSFERYSHLLCREIYSIARTAFQSKHDDLGLRAISILKEQNYTDHPGTFAHRTVASILGLQTKVRLWGR